MNKRCRSYDTIIVQDSRTRKALREHFSWNVMAEGQTRGQRFYLVRLACGDGVRRAEPMREFVQRVEAQTGLVIHPSVLSEIENDKATKTVTLEQVAAVASVDPRGRGKLWLAWGETVDATRKTDKELAAEAAALARAHDRANANVALAVADVPKVRDIPVEGMERVTSKKPTPRKRASDR